MRRLGESYSDVVLRLVELRGWTAGPVEGRPLEGRIRPKGDLQGRPMNCGKREKAVFGWGRIGTRS